MNKLTINKEELLELLEQDGTIQIDEYATKHDCHIETSVVYKDNKTYQVSVEYSYNEGIVYDKFNLYEVEPYKVEVTKWRIKK